MEQFRHAATLACAVTHRCYTCLEKFTYNYRCLKVVHLPNHLLRRRNCRCLCVANRGRKWIRLQIRVFPAHLGLQYVTTLLLLTDDAKDHARLQSESFERSAKTLARSRGNLCLISRNPIVNRYVWLRTCFRKIPLPLVIQFIKHKQSRDIICRRKSYYLY